ncbi:MAG: transporter substrate-binding domain-containing protein [Clostridiales Family XIII bacterium]|jgi:polar amino acid transport system substrate-binding protein|nr:transporter substrate-binding domain-containing protein [Clostridiales Family XIII bacterium]
MKKFIALLFIIAIAISGCGGNGDAADDSEQPGGSTTGKLDQIKSSGTLVMYTNAEFPPYEFIEGNEIVGVDVEIGKAIAEKLEVELEVVNADFGGIVASIASGKGDVAVSGITIDDERRAQVDFSTPYVESVQYIIVPENSDIGFVEDLSDKAVGVQSGTTGSMLVEDEINEGVLRGGTTDLKQYTSAPVAMQDLINGRIDAVVIDELVAIALANEHEAYTAMPLVYTKGSPMTEQFGVAVAKGNEDLLAIIDEVVGGMVADGLIELYIQEYSE